MSLPYRPDDKMGQCSTAFSLLFTHTFTTSSSTTNVYRRDHPALPQRTCLVGRDPDQVARSRRVRLLFLLLDPTQVLIFVRHQVHHLPRPLHSPHPHFRDPPRRAVLPMLPPLPNRTLHSSEDGSLRRSSNPGCQSRLLRWSLHYGAGASRSEPSSRFTVPVGGISTLTMFLKFRFFSSVATS